MEPRPAGPYRLRATSRRPAAFSEPVDVEVMAGEQREIRIEMHPALELSGHLDREAHGMADAGDITLRLRRREYLTENTYTLAMAAKTTLNRNGEFTFTGIGAGTYTIGIETDRGEHHDHRDTIEVGLENVENLELIPVRRE